LPSQPIEVAKESQPTFAISKNLALVFEQVNEVIWKLTNGDMTNVPASHGQWQGYRTPKALAWVINIGSSAWLARYRDQTCGPMSSSEAKAAAKAMVRGVAGDYSVSNPIAHLNGLTARVTASKFGTTRTPV
jgi:hypothetical protein